MISVKGMIERLCPSRIKFFATVFHATCIRANDLSTYIHTCTCLKRDTPRFTSHCKMRNAYGHACERAFTKVERDKKNENNYFDIYSSKTVL